jgi:hypothetical protein
MAGTGHGDMAISPVPMAAMSEAAGELSGYAEIAAIRSSNARSTG